MKSVLMKSVLITGGTGSFGQAFVKHLLERVWSVQRIVVYSRGEHLQEEMARKFPDPRMRFFIGDVRDRDRLELAMHGIDTVVHAAALKIVPAAEYNPTECIATNVTGAENVVKAAIRSGVKRVLALSTDKAVNPINLYGTSKLAAEKIFTAANNLAAGSCLFSVVRYGNVAGSRGSVIPLFKRMAAEGRRLPITHQDMTRFHITMDQAIDLVMFGLANMKGREIFIPKIPSLRVVDLAAAIAPGGNHEFIGIRPGEKIHETLISDEESRYTITFDRHFIISPDDIGGGIPMMTGRYTSDTNTEWLTIEQLQEIVR